MNDTLRIVTDSINVVLSHGKGTTDTQSLHEYCVLSGIIVAALAVCVIVWQICKFLGTARKTKLDHERDMLIVHRIKEERKQLLDFCYKMAEKKESDTRETAKHPDKDIQKLLHDKVYDKLETTFSKSDRNPSTNGDEGNNTEVTSNVKDPNYITLDQIRQDCWKIINDLKNDNIKQEDKIVKKNIEEKKDNTEKKEDLEKKPDNTIPD